MDKKISQLSDILKQHDQSVTTTRKTIFAALCGLKPMSMHELVDSVSDSVNRASVYRTVELFESIGVIKRIQIGWKYKLELADTFNTHHHHISCIRCGSVSDFEESDNLINELLQTAKTTGFEHVSHSLEISGI